VIDVEFILLGERSAPKEFERLPDGMSADVRIDGRHKWTPTAESLPCSGSRGTGRCSELESYQAFRHAIGIPDQSRRSRSNRPNCWMSAT
jgi:hypothetical protein